MCDQPVLYLISRNRTSKIVLQGAPTPLHSLSRPAYPSSQASSDPGAWSELECGVELRVEGFGFRGMYIYPWRYLRDREMARVAHLLALSASEGFFCVAKAESARPEAHVGWFVVRYSVVCISV